VQSVAMDSKEGRDVFNAAMLNIVTYLESLDDICNVELKLLGAGSPSEIASWERKNMPYKIPADMKAMCHLFNGFTLKWKMTIGSLPTEIGKIAINKLDGVVRIPLDGQFMSSEASGGTSASSMTMTMDPATNAAFVIDSQPMSGQVVLLYRTKTSPDPSVRGQPLGQFDMPEVWLQDNSLRWHFICSTFSQYCRLMIMHLGILGWPLIFTPGGVPPTTYQWMCIHCKERLILDLHWQKMLHPVLGKITGSAAGSGSGNVGTPGRKSPSAAAGAGTSGTSGSNGSGSNNSFSPVKKRVLTEIGKADSTSRIDIN
jgi:tubulin polyglutamylase complex subunit 2